MLTCILLNRVTPKKGSSSKKPTLRFESYYQILAFWCVFPVSHAPSASGIAPVLIVIQPQLLQRRAPPMPMFNPRVFSAMRNETARCVYMCLLVCQESAQFAATRVQPQNHPLAHALVPSHEIAEGKSWQEHELARAIERHRSASTTACNGACERHCNSSLKLPETEQGLPLEDNWSLTSERKNIFVLPCERLVPAEGVEDHSGGCCGDGTCTEQTGEDHVSCPADCSSRKGTSASAPLSTAPTIHTTDLCRRRLSRRLGVSIARKHSTTWDMVMAPASAPGGGRSARRAVPSILPTDDPSGLRGCWRRRVTRPTHCHSRCQGWAARRST
jgi:hypothetical protein